MLISTQTDRLTSVFGAKEALRMIKEAGFDCADFSFFGAMDTVKLGENAIEFAKDLRAYADSIGMRYNQAHAPFVFSYEKSVNYKTEIVPIIIKTIEICEILGVDTLIVHPLHFVSYKDNKEMLHDVNMEYYNILRPYAEKAGIRICLENMFQCYPRTNKIIPSVCCFDGGFTEYFDELSSDTFTCCLDVGHCGLVGTDPQDAIRILGHDRLGALHVHDNDFISDKHIAIGMGKIDWDSVAKAFADIDYKGVFTLEADNAFAGIQKEFMPEMLKYMYSSAKKVVDKIEEYKNAAK